MSDFESIEILLAEDDPRDAEMTLRSLRKHNFANRVHGVKDGAEALEFLGRESVETSRNKSLKLALLDIKMPKADGIEVLRRLKANEHTRNIPVVTMTSSNEKRDVVESYRLGVKSYIVKAVAFDAFVEIVAKIGL